MINKKSAIKAPLDSPVVPAAPPSPPSPSPSPASPEAVVEALAHDAAAAHEESAVDFLVPVAAVPSVHLQLPAGSAKHVSSDAVVKDKLVPRLALQFPAFRALVVLHEAS